MDKINWIPLKKFFKNDAKVLEYFMFMGSVKQDGITIYLYKHQDTRRYINLDSKGNTYKYVQGDVKKNLNTGNGSYTILGNYVKISKSEAIKELKR